jgi:signal transduction histidine kinase
MEYRVRLICRCTAILAASLGGIAIIGWYTGNTLLTETFLGRPSMKANTAFGPMLGAFTLWIPFGPQLFDRVASRLISIAIILLGVLTLLEYLLQINLGIDQLIISDTHTDADGFLGRMSVITAVCFVLFGAGRLIANHRGTMADALFVSSYVTGLCTMYLVFLGYLYGSPGFYSPFSMTSIALHTAIGFVFLFVGLALLRPDIGWVHFLHSDSVGATFVRLMLPVVVIVVPLMGWLRLQGELAGWYDLRFGLALFAIVNVIILTSTLWVAGRKADQLDDARQAANDRLKDVQEQLLHLSRLTEMGQFASVISHEIRQPLTAIAAAAMAARRKILHLHDPVAVESASLIETVVQHTFETSKIMEATLNFSKNVGGSRTEEKLNEVIKEALTLGLIGARDVKMKLRLAEDLPLLVIDKIQIQQVLINLMRNSVEALQSVSRREITIVTSADEQFVRVVVADTGPGVPTEVVAKLFQPFVTTKTKGVGIGLSLCRSIIEAHGGAMWAGSNEAGGATFYFQLRRQ